jgi:hypothetical protein
MSALPVPQPEDSDEQLPIDSKTIGDINRTPPMPFNSDQVRQMRRKVRGYTGYLLIEVKDGIVLEDGIHRIRNLNQIIEPTEK